MADKITSTKTLSIGYKYTDDTGKDKIAYLQLPNPDDNLDETTIRTAALTALQLLRTPQGDPMTDTNIFTAYKEDVLENDFDIGITN